MGFLAMLAGILGRYSSLSDARPESNGWGIDACLSIHADAATRAAYLRKLSGSGVAWLRERQPEPAMRRLHQRGYHTVAFTSFALGPASAGNQLPEDLAGVYDAARSASRENAGVVDAWEMVGEPDLGYCTDLPDRVAAYQKTVYLGLKAGAAEPKETRAKRVGQGAEPFAPSSSLFATNVPLVLMGALGAPPGPWLERFAANDGLAYTDAYNFHFYGHAEDLSGVIAAHRAAMTAPGAKGEERRVRARVEPSQDTLSLAPASLPTSVAPLPMWITECGIEAVDKKDFLNPQRRQLQADFTIATARQALAADDVAMFMPFILVHEADPYAMTLSPTKTLPAWEAYAKFTRENPWPKRALSRERTADGGRGKSDVGAVNPLVMQWLPDNATCVPHKVSGTYRFKGRQPIKGELRIYNFGVREASGKLELGELKVGRVVLNAPKTSERGASGITRPTGDLITVPAMGMVSVPVEIAPTASGYFRETFSVTFIEDSETARRDAGPPAERVSIVSFGLEAWAKIEDFVELPLALRALPDGRIQFPQIEPYAAGPQAGVWTTINGLKSDIRRQPSDVDQQFWIEQENTDPLAPTMAVAAVDGLPAFAAESSGLGAESKACFLRLQLDKPMTADRKVLVVLVDDRGQRYTIWENFGADYYGSRSDIWLNLEDFHADFWGRMSADYQFRPERIREVHLRCYLSTPNDQVGVRLTLLRAKGKEGKGEGQRRKGGGWPMSDG